MEFGNAKPLAPVEPISVSKQQLIDILSNTDAEEIGLDYKSAVKMNKRGNPLAGRDVCKTVHATYSFGGSFRERLNEATGETVAAVKSLRWGEFVEGSNGRVIRHIKQDSNGNDVEHFYIRYYNATSKIGTVYTIDGFVPTEDEMETIRTFTKSGSKKNSTYVTESGDTVENDKVVVNVLDFENILEITIGGEVFNLSSE